MPQLIGYQWQDNMHEVAARNAKRACMLMLLDLLRESGCKTIGEAKAKYRAKNELDMA